MSDTERQEARAEAIATARCDKAAAIAEADRHKKAVSNGVAFLPSSDAYYEFLGEHPYPHAPEEIPCETCNGLGSVPTEIGEALLAFLRPRFAEAVRT
jgi:hypothetical protein